MPFDFGDALHPLVQLPVSIRSCPQLDLAHPPAGWDLSDRNQLFAFVAPQLADSAHGVLWGGYLERRQVYASAPEYQGQEPRNVHLGVDVWANAGTEILAPLFGYVHAFADNAGFSNYGPTVILRHHYAGRYFHTLYGHLDRKTLEGLQIGQEIGPGQVVGRLGEREENGDWPPHLHFQVILDLPDDSGDYPGVSTESAVEWYGRNCPDPGGVLG